MFLDDGDTTIAICMEYCEAGSLEDIYKRARDLGGVIGEPVLERIAESVCKGLVYLHSMHVIHRGKSSVPAHPSIIKLSLTHLKRYQAIQYSCHKEG